VDLFLNVLRFLLIGAGIVFAVEWWRHPDHHYDILLGISVAVVALVEFLRGLWESRRERQTSDRAAGEAKQANAELNAKLDAALESFQAALSKAQTQSPRAATPPAPAEDPQAKRFRAIIEQRQQIEKLIRDYAKQTGADSSGSAEEVLSRLNMPAPFRNGIMLYLDNTRDLPRQPEAMLEWAAANAHVYIGTLELMMKNARQPAP